MTKGVLPLDTLKLDINLNTGFFETSAYTEDAQMQVTSGNHDGAGMSAGNLQYNYGAADRLQELFAYMVTNYPAVVTTAFGANTAQKDEFVNVTNTYTRTNRITWADGITDYVADSAGHKLKEPYKTSFANLLITAECKAKYYSMRDAYYWGNPFEVFRQMSCISRMALASFFDVYVNKGRCYPINLLQVDFEAIDANTTIDAAEKERQKIVQINERANSEENSLNDTSSSTFAPRRNAMRDQGGTYFGANYDPDVQFDMNQEPAIAEKAPSTGVKLGSIDVQDVFLGITPIKSIYLGADLIGGTSAAYTTSTAPQTQLRTNPNSYAGIGAVTEITLTQGQPMWVDVQNFVACRTYYTIDGTEPTQNSTLYDAAISFQASCTLKVKTFSIFGVAEATKTLTITIAVAPTTTISPSSTIQSSIPFTVTLTTSEAGAAIKYKLGTGTTVYDYTAPFEVSQNSPGVASTQIKVTYWAVGATATEAEKSITYDTASAVPGKPVLTATAGTNKVDLSWTAAANTTSYTLYRSTAAGTLGTYIGTQYMANNVLSYSDTTAVAGTTYYYTIRAGNYATGTNSDQKSATPTAAPAVASYRYLRIEGYGAAETGQEVTTRTVELEAYVGATNVALNKTIVSGETPSTGAAPLATVVNGNKTTVTAGAYPIWWTATPNGHVVIDLGSSQALTKLSYYGYSVSGTQRTNRFIIQGSNTNNGTDWVNIWDNSAGQAGLQPVLPGGYDKTL